MSGTLALGDGGSVGSVAGNVVNGGTLVFNRSGDFAYAGVVSGTGATTKLGSGTLTLTGDVSVTGTHAPGNSPGVQTIGGSLSYDLGGGTGPSMEWQLAADTVSNSPLAFDQVLVGTNLSFTTDTLLFLQFASAGSTVDWTDVFWGTDHQWTIWQVAGATSGLGRLSIQVDDWLDAFSQRFAASLPGAGFSIGLGANGKDVVLSDVTVVPEPSTWVSLLAGGAILAWRTRRRVIGRRA